MSSKNVKSTLYAILFGAVLGFVVQPTAAQDLRGFSRPRTVTKAVTTNKVPAGQKATITGNVIKADANTISVCDMSGAETVVVLSPSTKISTHRRGIFRAAEVRDKTSLLIGLRVQVNGRGNDNGQLNAKWVKFHDSDYRSETQIDTRAIPIEAEQVRQGEQLEETTVVASTALKNAKTAQDTADKAQDSARKAQTTADVAKNDAATAQSTATSAHNRIAAIDDFETVEALTINFNSGSSRLSPSAKSKLDNFAAKALGSKGFVIEISGFTSREGREHYNHALSSRRAEAVMDYLVGIGHVPIRRIVTPFSGGEMNPVADNKTRAGRAQNRRVEVKMLVSKGLASKERVTAKSE
ncbi:MAG TPA: OmpA family protein [Blastocatellia bacterium]|nr:OmpA family protein [Blastocatellia bacterium]